MTSGRDLITRRSSHSHSVLGRARHLRDEVVEHVAMRYSPADLERITKGVEANRGRMCPFWMLLLLKSGYGYLDAHTGGRDHSR